jgi:NTP pyrophosphatase (non-canonical NTP hydrolase)
MDDIFDFQYNVRKWAVDRNIYAESSPLKQLDKTREEVDELGDGIMKGNRDEVKDAIGDILVTLVNVSFYYDLCLEECWGQAWDDIKDRKGKMINGVFCKES